MPSVFDGLPKHMKMLLDRGKLLHGSGPMCAAWSWSDAYPAVTSVPIGPACPFEQAAAATWSVLETALAASMSRRPEHPEEASATRRRTATANGGRTLVIAGRPVPTKSLPVHPKQVRRTFLILATVAVVSRSRPGTIN